MRKYDEDTGQNVRLGSFSGIKITHMPIHKCVRNSDIRNHIFKFLEWVCPDDITRILMQVESSQTSLLDYYKDGVDFFEYATTEDAEMRTLMKPMRKQMGTVII